MTGLYIHVPFCLRKCPYCSFYSVAYDKDTANKYVTALCNQISLYGGRKINADTVYFGGGTPSLLSSEQVGKILDRCYSNFNIDKAEITLEANPCTVDESKLSQFRRLGINRISFGVQSAEDSRLKLLGRLHNGAEAEQAIINAEGAGFEHISADVMLGLDKRGGDDLKLTLEKVCSLPVDHISAYMLKREAGTAFADAKYDALVADDEQLCEQYLYTVEYLDRSGFKQYEISNFAKSEGAQSRHNLKYWQGEEYLGFGPAAHSFFNGKRFCYKNDLAVFISGEADTIVITDEDPDTAEEYIMLGLRLTKGINFKRLEELYSPSAAKRVREQAARLEKYGYTEVNDDSFKLTPKGFLVSNTVIFQVIEAANG